MVCIPSTRSLAQLLSLPPAVRAMIAIEPNEHSFSLDNALELYQQCGSPIILDTLHRFTPTTPGVTHSIRRSGLPTLPGPMGSAPKCMWLHSARRVILLRRVLVVQHMVLAPRPGQHADFINPFEFAILCEELAGLPGCDSMLEAKAGDMALLRLRDDLRRYAPEAHSLLEGDDAVTGGQDAYPTTAYGCAGLRCYTACRNATNSPGGLVSYPACTCAMVVGRLPGLLSNSCLYEPALGNL